MAKTDDTKSWFSMTAKAGNAPPEILIYDDIGAWGVSASVFAAALKALDIKPGEEAHLRLNTPGGDCFHGNNIYNALLGTGAKWTIYIDGVAASMGSLIATLPGAEVVIAANAFIMIHNPSAFAGGEAKDLRKTAKLLDSIRDGMARAYMARSGLEREEVESIMDDETWYDADEAIAKNFADKKGSENRLAAKFDLTAKFKDIPENVVKTLGKFSAGPAKTPKAKESEMDKNDIAAAVTEANKPLAEGLAALVAALTPKAKTEDKTDDKAVYKAYVAEVRSLCALAGLPNEVDAFVDAETPVAEVRTKLAEKQATARARRTPAAPVTGRITTSAGATDENEPEDYSDLIPKQTSNAEAFKRFHGKYAGRH